VAVIEMVKYETYNSDIKDTNPLHGIGRDRQSKTLVGLGHLE
jgi:hypothetical protein